MTHTAVAVCTRGVEPLLRAELLGLGVEDPQDVRGGVRFQADAATLYRVVLWSRLASRILRELAHAPVQDADGLFELASGVSWAGLFAPAQRFRVDVSGTHPRIEHTGFAALKVKDAVVDGFRAATGTRPDVDREQPDVVVHLHLDADQVSLSLDLCGRPLHERGWRRESVLAPLKETLAAALLVRAGWPALAASGAALLDPCCGSGSLLIEGLWMACDVAPSWLRRDYTVQGLADFDGAVWTTLRNEIEQRARAGLSASGVRAWGADADPKAVTATRRNAEAAGVAHLLQVSRNDLHALPAAPAESGLLICNPPYGERLEDVRSLLPLYRALGQGLRQHYGRWATAVYTSDPQLIEAINLPVRKRHQLLNGPLKCTLVQLDASRAPSSGPRLSPGAVMLRNRMDKNLARLRSYLSAQQIGCFRAYDADLPEYACAVDVYTDLDQQRWLHIQEYAAPRSIPEADQERHLRELVQVAGLVHECPPERIHLKQRQRQRGSAQYQRQQRSGQSIEVLEDGLVFEVNLGDFLDTGLFLDSRILRQRVRQLARDRRFLNLFCYTGSASVHAAAGGARSSVSVDLSPTYTRWAGRNFARNDMDPAHHRIVAADALSWLGEPGARFDLIYLDPPTFSNSKRTPTVLDTRRDHAELVDAAMARLERHPEACLLFCTNAQGIQLDPTLAERYRIEEWTEATIPPDFRRPRRIHHSYRIRHQG